MQSKSASAKIVRCVHHLADAGDRFVLDIAHNLQDIGTRAQAEASGMLESVGLAYDATLGLTHQLLSATGGDRAQTDSAPAVPADDDPDETVPVEPRGVAVLRADSGPYDPNAPEEEESHPAGILPVLEALERILHEDSPRDGRALEKDSRFWKVIELLHVLRPPQSEAMSEEP
jgi:hypothetical protein